MELIQSIDTNILLFIQEHLRCGFINAVMIFCSAIGTAGILWITTGIAMIVTKKYRRTGILLFVCLAATWVLNDLAVKNLVQRPRPYLSIPELRVLVPLQTDFSFPSGHTSTSFACAFVLTRLGGRRWAWVYIVAGMIAVSRLFVGVHYPADVLAGAIFGALSAAVVVVLARRLPIFKNGSENSQ
ncbi:MAG: phosphatase PAP2 family protein [Clostridiales bacterium]|nr:phosphatase PAP2 family protein [Clostridiales bacterium]